MATLLQVKGCHADASQIQRLTQALVQKEGEVKILNAKISSLEKQKVVYATFNVCFQFFSCKPVLCAQAYSNSFKPFGGKEKKICSTDFFLVGAHVHCLDETDLNTGSIGLD